MPPFPYSTNEVSAKLSLIEVGRNSKFFLKKSFLNKS